MKTAFWNKLDIMQLPSILAKHWHYIHLNCIIIVVVLLIIVIMVIIINHCYI